MMKTKAFTKESIGVKLNRSRVNAADVTCIEIVTFAWLGTAQE
jgi:hypothetical protein